MLNDPEPFHRNLYELSSIDATRFSTSLETLYPARLHPDRGRRLRERLLRAKGTPDAIIAKLHQQIVAAASQPEVRKRMDEVGAEPGGGTQAEMRAMLREQISKVKPVVEEPKLVVQ